MIDATSALRTRHGDGSNTGVAIKKLGGRGVELLHRPLTRADVSSIALAVHDGGVAAHWVRQILLENGRASAERFSYVIGRSVRPEI
jgi:hypothetical protein